MGAKEQSGRTWSSLYLDSRDNQYFTHRINEHFKDINNMEMHCFEPDFQYFKDRDGGKYVPVLMYRYSNKNSKFFFLKDSQESVCLCLLIIFSSV